MRRFQAPIYDSTTTGQTDTGKASTAKTTTELQTPTAAGASEGDIYYGWNTEDYDGDGNADAVWDFGTSTQYPALKIDFDGDGTATVAELAVSGDGNVICVCL